MWHRSWAVSACSLRCYSTKTPIKLVAELRKLTEVSIVKAREALEASNNDVNAALKWLDKDLAASGAKRAAKVQDRHAGEGLIAVSLLSPGAGGRSALRAAMVELNCETDFVGRNDLFGQLAADIAHTAAFMSEQADFQNYPVDVLNDTPLLSARHLNPDPSTTVSRAIRDLISKVGENVVLKRAMTVFQEPSPNSKEGHRLISYLHGSVNDPMQGRIGVLGLLKLSSPQSIFQSTSSRENLERLERALARQIAGFETRSIHSDSQDETALYQQPFMIAGDLSGKPVGEALAAWSTTHGLDQSALGVERFVKWAVGEPNEEL
ncbi:Elongation factor Ts, mitochondrial [Mycena indigotica]|uniref:Elongation factor Ts, mitochondrial n=1 Tax=Mycena indigotica TaxID=2126181 RepID=A0A8H6W9Z8_9AGAR|nr:Elongation factor Ts, mitochondrial [Mycena indigotica]KAF7307158.1 Elongation factor Ts, mitochondrial [Mycena indigotica]